MLRFLFAFILGFVGMFFFMNRKNETGERKQSPGLPPFLDEDTSKLFHVMKEFQKMKDRV